MSRKYQIYLSNNERDTLFYEKNGKIFNFNDVLATFNNGDTYEYVANVFTDTLEEVYESTQTFRMYWFERQNVELVVDRAGLRSVSVGDIIVDTETGNVYVVADFGFDKLPLLLPSNLTNFAKNLLT